MGDELIKRVPAFPSSADDGPGVTQWMDPRLLFERQRAREGQRPRRVDTAYRGGRKRGVRPSAAPWLEDFFLFFFTFVLSTGSCHTDSHQWEASLRTPCRRGAQGGTMVEPCVIRAHHLFPHPRGAYA